ncbi:4-hydroxythreonine-4-phosphate dehydrogenase PdxA [Cobetia marina]|uniref:4-hydroxythreonine-4-phosphate dehydrogenase PdxA n=1 Tax=Cobetia marina TaxID=28258 RepID=UPI003A9505BF
MSSKVIALTAGEPAGIGPELLVMLAAQAEDFPAQLVAVADPDLLASRARLLGLSLELHELSPGDPLPPARNGHLAVWSVPLAVPSEPGVIDARNGDHVLQMLDVAIAACQAGHASAMVTAPLSKAAVIEAGHAGFTGHTEYLRDVCGVEEVVMMLACPGLRVALATTHLPLREVADAITPQGLTRVLTILAEDLKRYFGRETPRIAVCGLNPHAGEGGHLGVEEIEVISPTLEALRATGMQLAGPLPADTLFTPRHLDGVDAVLAMYHDQGLPVLKYAGFGQAANITLGLPIVRTSVDHGTALDLAGTGRADVGSLVQAVQVAIEMAAAARA